MNVLWLYRVFTFALACILSFVVIVLCVRSSDNLGVILRAFGDDDTFPYPTLGIAIGCMTLISYIIMLALDFFIENVFTSMLVFEIAWSSVLWVLWISVGATTLSEGNTIFKGRSCSEFDVVLPMAKDICVDIHPIGSISFVAYALLFLYTGVLVVVGFSSFGSTTAWKTTLKSRNKY
ncbi:hypothetical protein C8Q79DRAFT_898528 [Trametes meyenii]|nr:hypothetical protein C8Q79DRAFT_898528 [Trametes meyenii]